MNSVILPEHFLQQKYNEAETLVSNGVDMATFTAPYTFLEDIIGASEKCKGVYTVFLTSIVYKCLYPEQDIRMHQTSIDGGYSGRTFDTKYITPFLKEKDFPAMAESGWLTRSLEQKVPYDKNYTGAIRPISLKRSFLEGIDFIQNASSAEVETLLINVLAALITQRLNKTITLAKPTQLNIEQIVDLLKLHFSAPYPVRGAARLPVLAIYAVYELMTVQMKRFEGKMLLPLERHTSADLQSGRVGDIDIVDKELGKPYEAVEVKLNIPITYELLLTIRNKVITHTLDRYYVLSTIITSDKEQLKERANIVQEIKNINGCQLIINGIYETLKYYLRLLEKPELFVEKYVSLLEKDLDIKFEHREMWNHLVNEQMRI